jgi:tRNA threonylcarbamoyladenosine biosynthesis protein TsaB|tara:strand:- start:605 stop:1255 length:651 start_codon:yes stop_codon:yes gene_type:complete
MNILAFDTSTEKFSISILKNNKIVLNLSKILNKTYSKFLVSILKKSLEKSNLDIKKIDCILISLGPGSFTGIRLGIAAAKGLGMPHKICILGYSNMDVLVNSVDKNIKKKIITIIKSKKNDYYFQVFNTKKKPLIKTSFFSINNLPKFFFNKNVVFSGDLDLDLIKEIKKKNKFFFYKRKFSNARMLINLIKEKHYIKKNTSLDPIYVYNHYASKN